MLKGPHLKKLRSSKIHISSCFFMPHDASTSYLIYRFQKDMESSQEFSPETCALYSMVWNLHNIRNRTKYCYTKHYKVILQWSVALSVIIPSLDSPTSFHGIQCLARAPHFHCIRTVKGTVMDRAATAHVRGLHLAVTLWLTNVSEICVRPQSWPLNKVKLLTFNNHWTRWNYWHLSINPHRAIKTTPLQLGYSY